ncbi:carboxypeptidase-like regulatory domain-containing protein [Bacteroides faecis]|uniref:carboxypeptidase-like regulatory domain-containing protein n=1 Tax=Bacteroides faecis TaxID=674529 RepID=UPI0021666F65|nr:carboxypeptidase-like regulatory domain-containing protein [Bacteroides faecis]MCS2578114.1 carboxypeptidase-like regulatory domain-containing protein [Bacteroides faecis]
MQIRYYCWNTITNVDGQFRINAKNKDVLVVSFVGMRTEEVKLSGQKSVNVVLPADIASLDEWLSLVMVLKKRGSLTSAISTVSDKELLKAPSMRMSNVLVARVAANCGCSE